jgi:putative transcriptional regulator
VLLADIRSCRWYLLGAVLLIALCAWQASTLFPDPAMRGSSDVSLPAHLGPDRTLVLPVQHSRHGSLAKGKLLVASDTMRDPHFAEAVILLVTYNEQGAMGVIINRATQVKLSELLPRVKGLEQRGDTIYEGGPVERSEILMLVRSAKEPEDSRVVFGDVYLSASAELLKRLAAESPRNDPPFRVYSGYAGWAAGQLESEVELGAWHIFPASAGTVFASRPEDLWREFIDHTTLRLARQIVLPRACYRGSSHRKTDPA